MLDKEGLSLTFDNFVEDSIDNIAVIIWSKMEGKKGQEKKEKEKLRYEKDGV